MMMKITRTVESFTSSVNHLLKLQHIKNCNR